MSYKSAVRLQNSFVRVAGCHQRGDQLGDVVGTTRFHGDVDGCVSEVDVVVGAVVGSFDNVGAMLGENSSEPVQGSGIVGEMDAQTHQAAIFHQAAFDDAGEQGDINVAAAYQYGHALAGEREFAIQHRGDGGRARALG